MASLALGLSITETTNYLIKSEVVHAIDTPDRGVIIHPDGLRRMVKIRAKNLITKLFGAEVKNK